MAEVLLFHHAQGLTAGCVAFADQLRAAGHLVHTPDLYDGSTFIELTDGVAYAEQVGFGTIIERGRLAAEGLPSELVSKRHIRERAVPANPRSSVSGKSKSLKYLQDQEARRQSWRTGCSMGRHDHTACIVPSQT